MVFRGLGGQLIFDTCIIKAIQWSMKTFQQMILEQLHIHMQKQNKQNKTLAHSLHNI